MANVTNLSLPIRATGGNKQAVGNLPIVHLSALPIVTGIVLGEIVNGGIDADISFDTLSIGDIYVVAIPTASIAPTAAQIIAGTDGSDAAADFATSVAADGTGSINVDVSGLTNDVSHTIYAMHKIGTINSAAVASAAFTPVAPVGITAALVGSITAAENFDSITTVSTGTLGAGYYVGAIIMDYQSSAQRDVSAWTLAGAGMTERNNTWLPYVPGAQFRTIDKAASGGSDMVVTGNNPNTIIAAACWKLTGTGITYVAGGSIPTPNSGSATRTINVNAEDIIFFAIQCDDPAAATADLTLANATLVGRGRLPNVDTPYAFYKTKIETTGTFDIVVDCGSSTEEIRGLFNQYRES